MQHERLIAKLVEMFGDCDAAKLKEIRDRQIVAPYYKGYQENDVPECCRELITGIYGTEATEAQVNELVEARYQTFVDIIELKDHILPLLDDLRKYSRLALLSNFPCGRSIRDGLDKLGMTSYFDAIVVSDEIGWVKPDPRPYQALLNALGESPADCTYIGDNWLADIQGAKQMGMRAVLTTEHLPYERFEPQEGDFKPDAQISELSTLRELFIPSC